MASVVERLYAIGIKPDWWKLEAQPSTQAWAYITDVIKARDPLCRGIMMLGLEAPEGELFAAFELAKGCAMVKGFAVGRTIFAAPAAEWFARRIDDAAVTARMAAGFERLVQAWQSARV